MGYRIGKFYPLTPWVHKETTIISGPGIDLVDLIIDDDGVLSFEMRHHRFILVYNRKQKKNELMHHNIINGVYEGLDSSYTIEKQHGIRNAMGRYFKGMIQIHVINSSVSNQILKIVLKTDQLPVEKK